MSPTPQAVEAARLIDRGLEHDLLGLIDSDRHQAIAELIDRAFAERLKAADEMEKAIEGFMRAFPDLDKYEDGTGKSLAPLAKSICTALAAFRKSKGGQS
jgi:hypothetical protein